MKPIQNFRIDSVPLHCIAAAVTVAESSYEESRTLLAEDFPDYGDYTVIEGSHCSCYGFADTQWSAITYTADELRKLIPSWLTQRYGTESRFAQAILPIISE